MKPKAVLIIGVGTAYRNDDAVGLIVAERLRARLPEGASIITHEGEGVSLMEQLADSEAAVLIDAMNSGVEPGTVQRFDAGTQPLPAQVFRHSTHAFGVAQAIELGRALGKLPRRLIVYGIEGQDFEAGTQLSHAVESSVEMITRCVIEEARQLLALEELRGKPARMADRRYRSVVQVPAEVSTNATGLVMNQAVCNIPRSFVSRVAAPRTL